MSNEADVVARAREGDREALNELVQSMKELVYNLAIRMLGSPADAEDASQEILIRLVTHLNTFRGESSFRTWVYRVASNELLKERKRKFNFPVDTFEDLGDYLAEGVVDPAPSLDDQMLVREAKLRCTSAMLNCLDKPHRVAFILGEILELSSEEASAVLEIDDAAYRKRLSRARERVSQFMSSTCGLVNPKAPCRCAKQAGRALAHGALDPNQLGFARHPVLKDNAQQRLAAVDEMQRAVAVFRSHPEYAAPESVIAGLKELLARPTALLPS